VGDQDKDKGMNNAEDEAEQEIAKKERDFTTVFDFSQHYDRKKLLYVKCKMTATTYLQFDIRKNALWKRYELFIFKNHIILNDTVIRLE
jgi:hypothetical protein